MADHLDWDQCERPGCQKMVRGSSDHSMCWQCRRDLGLLPPRNRQKKRDTNINYTDAEFGDSTKWLRRPLR